MPTYEWFPLCMWEVIFAHTDKHLCPYLGWDWNQNYTAGSRWCFQNTGCPQGREGCTGGHGPGLQTRHTETSLTTRTSSLQRPDGGTGSISTQWVPPTSKHSHVTGIALTLHVRFDGAYVTKVHLCLLTSPVNKIYTSMNRIRVFWPEIMLKIPSPKPTLF